MAKRTSKKRTSAAARRGAGAKGRRQGRSAKRAAKVGVGQWRGQEEVGEQFDALGRGGRGEAEGQLPQTPKATTARGEYPSRTTRGERSGVRGAGSETTTPADEARGTADYGTQGSRRKESGRPSSRQADL